MSDTMQTSTSAPGDYSALWPAGIIGLALGTTLLNCTLAVVAKCHFREVQSQMDRPAAQAPVEPAAPTS